MTNTFKQSRRKLTAISHCESSGELSVSMVLAHTFTGQAARDHSNEVNHTICQDETAILQGSTRIEPESRGWEARIPFFALVQMLLKKTKTS